MLSLILNFLFQPFSLLIEIHILFLLLQINMNFRLQIEKQRSPQQNLKHFIAQGQRRLVASSPQEQQQYIDYRNLWKASTPNQQKQYKAIRQSGLMNEHRKITFLKFNYRHSQDKSLTYGQIYKSMFQIPKHIKNKKYESYEEKQNKTQKKYKLKNKAFVPLSKQIIQKVNDGTLKNDRVFACSAFLDESQVQKRKSKFLRGNYLKPFQSTNGSVDYKQQGNSDTNWFDRFCEQKNEEEEHYPENNENVVPGSMNVCDLWGQKQLKESLGFLPCVRDRPKLLKLYSQKIHKSNRIKQNNLARCATEV